MLDGERKMIEGIWLFFQETPCVLQVSEWLQLKAVSSAKRGPSTQTLYFNEG